MSLCVNHREREWPKEKGREEGENEREGRKGVFFYM
jgi:hypothetical protein